MSDVKVMEAKTKKGRASSKVKKAKNAPAHPKVSEMVNSAISSLKERGGSSLQAIKKYVSFHYKVDAEKLSPFIKKYLKTAVVKGDLVQTKGKGANGSFKMGGGAKEKSTAKAKVSSPKKSAVVKKAPEKKKAKKVTPAKKPKPSAKPAKKGKIVKTVTKQKKPKASPKKTAAKKGRK